MSKCSEAVSKPASKELSYEEMCAEEGVYKIVGLDASQPYRLVVLRTYDISTVLYYIEGYLVPATRDWESYKFVKVDAEVCFEIKEKHA